MLKVARGDRGGVDDLRIGSETDPARMSALADVMWAYRMLGDRDATVKATRAYLDEPNPLRLEEDAFNIARARSLVSGALR